MPWVKFDDRCTEHPKIARLSKGGVGLWFAGTVYCNRNLTDGFIPDAMAHGKLVGESAVEAAELVAAGLWVVADGGYQVHDFLDYQPSREDVLAERERSSERVARHRERRRNAGGNGDVTPVKRRSNGDVTVVKQASNAGPVPVPVNNPNPLKPLSSSRSDLDRVWAAYVDHHPQAKFTKARRDLIERRLRDHDADTLIAAVTGNHRSPFHCGENEGGKLYHDLGLILRDADKVEAFAALAAEQPTDRLARKGKLSPRELAALADELDGGDPFGFAQIEAAS